LRLPIVLAARFARTNLARRRVVEGVGVGRRVSAFRARRAVIARLHDRAADRLYERLGWTRFGTVPGYAMRADNSMRATCSFFYKEL